MNDIPSAECPACGSKMLYVARMSGGDSAPGLLLRHEHQKRFYLGGYPGVTIPDTATVCRDCGLVWTKIDPRKLDDFFAKGNELCAKELRAGQGSAE